MPLRPGKPTTANAKVYGPKNPITEGLAKKWLGWKEAKEGEPHLLKDLAGRKIRCTKTEERQRPYDKSLAQRWMWEILGPPYREEINPETGLGGNWQLTGESIVIGRNGLNIEGKHRLIALVLACQKWQEDPAQFPAWPTPPVLPAVVVKGISESPAVVNVINTGKPRSFADALYAAGMYDDLTPSERKRITTITSYAVQLVWYRTGAGLQSLSPRASYADWIDFLDRHPHILEASKHVYEEAAGSKKILVSKIGLGNLAGFLYLMGCSRSDPTEYLKNLVPFRRETELDWEFWDKACDFIVLIAQEAQEVGPLRVALARLLDEDGGGTRRQRWSLLALAWLRYALGKPITAKSLQLKYIDQEDGSRELAETISVGGIDLGDPSQQDEETIAADDPTPEQIIERSKKERATPLRRGHRSEEGWESGNTAWVYNPKRAEDKPYFARLTSSPYRIQGVFEKVVSVEEGENQWDDIPISHLHIEHPDVP